MKKFIFRSFIYLLIIVAVNAVILRIAENRYWKISTPAIKKKLIDKGEHEVSIVLGASQAYHGAKSNLIGNNFYNLAANSQSLLEDFYILKNLSGSKDVKSVILSISYSSNHFYLATASSGERTRIFEYEHVYGIWYNHDVAYYKNKFNFMGPVAKSLIENSVNTLHDQYGNLNYVCDFNLSMDKKKHNVSDSATKFKSHNQKADFDVINPYLDSIIAFCSGRDIKLNLVVFPLTKGYKNEIKRNNPRSEFENFLNKLKQRQSDKMKFIDCRDLIADNEDAYFKDADHVNACGRDSLSGYLSRVILR